MSNESQATGLLLKTLLDEMQHQRKTSGVLADAMSRNALEVQQLSIQVHQLHKDLTLIGSLTERVLKIEQERAEERARGRAFAAVAAAICAAVGAIAAMVVPPLASKLIGG